MEDKEKKKVINDALGEKMNAVYNYGERRKEEGIKEGIKEEKKDTAIKMIEDNQNNAKIKEYTELDDNTINQIRKELKN